MKINLEQLQQYISEGHNRADAARHFGVTRGAISQALNNPKRTHQITKSSLDMMGQIRMMMQTIFAQFVKAEQQGILTPDAHKTIRTLTKLAAEFRQQLETVVRVAEAWDTHRQIEEFKDEVMSVIEEFRPGVQEQIWARLEAKRAGLP